MHWRFAIGSRPSLAKILAQFLSDTELAEYEKRVAAAFAAIHSILATKCLSTWDRCFVQLPAAERVGSGR